MTAQNRGWTPQPWVLIPLPNPEELPGYTEAVATLERGESLFPKTAQAKRVTTPRPRRTVESLTADRDELVARRDLLGGSELPDDPGALSGIRRKADGRDRKHAAKTDRDLAKYTVLTERINYLESRIRSAL